ncbi:protein BEX4 isoform 1-T1 [Dama dama]|uniref:protein BEX4 isoform X1 n=2 Tax=Dama dama TaxID=30532 RepID=UPI002A361C80|nr:protein BEX4 isoform X1 [Dama dama]
MARASGRSLRTSTRESVASEWRLQLQRHPAPAPTPGIWPRKAVCESEVLRRRTCSKNQEEQETERIGPGAMASKEERAIESFNMEDAQQENEEGDQAPLKTGEESRDLGGGKVQKSGGNIRLGWVRRLVPNFRWAIPNRHIDHNEVGDNVEKHVGQMMEIKRKTKKQQMRHHVPYQTPEPDNHYEFCLIP